MKLTIRETAEPTPIATPTPGEGEARVSDVIGGAGDGKVGLAWKNPSSSFTAVEVRRKTGSYPQNPYDGTMVYRGVQDNFVDTDLVNGTEYFYAVVVYDEGNLPSPIEEENRISLTPHEISLFGTHDPFADRVISYDNLSDNYGFGLTWLIGTTPEDTEDAREDVAAMQEGLNDTPVGDYVSVIGGSDGRAESGPSPDTYLVTGLGGSIDGTYARVEETEVNGSPVYRNGAYYIYYAVYFETDTYRTSRALGAPRGAGSYQGSQDVVSLQAKVNDGDPPCGGSIILEFTDNIVVNGNGDDFTVFENVFYIDGDESKRFMEPAMVYVSQNGSDYYRFPCNYSQGHNRGVFNPETYDYGFTGINPVFSNNGSPDPTRLDENPGGDSFNLDDITAKNLTWIRYIKLKSTGDNWLTDDDGDMIRHNRESGACSGLGSSGFDLDAISAVNY